MIDGRYSLQRELGRGGMGAVWLARDEVLGRDVAIKHIPIATERGADSRAWREARLAAGLNDPHLVAVFDLLPQDDELWLVMEYVDGPSLAQRVRERGPMSPSEAARIVDDVAAGLQTAHAAGVVHRDVKPSNILVPAEGPAKLGDFGIARCRAGEATLTLSDTVMGSPAYLSPEVAAGAAAGPASDVWSLGATLFHMLTGRPPYEDGGNVLGMLYRIVNEPPPTTDRAAWLAPLLAGTMAQAPADRWSLAQVRAFLAAGPTTEPPRGTSLLADLFDAEYDAGPVTAVLPAVATQPVAPAPAGRRLRPWLAMSAVLTVVVAVAVVAAVALNQHDSSTATGAPRGSDATGVTGASGAASSSPSPSSPSPSSPSPHSPSPSSPRPSASAPTAAGVRSFVDTYLATAPTDPAAGYAMLTRRYQAASGGLAGYRSFWGEVSTIHSVENVRSTLRPLTATYTYSYTRRHVGRVTETIRLRLVYVDGRYLIAGGSSLR